MTPAELHSKLMVAASCASAASLDLIEEARDNAACVNGLSNVGSGETITALAEAAMLLLEVNPARDEDENQLHGALVRFLEDGA